MNFFKFVHDRKKYYDQRRICMKKTMILALLSFTAFSAFASDITPRDKANLKSLKIVIEVSRSSIENLTAETNERLESYDSLGSLSLVGRQQMKKENCKNINSSLVADLTMISASLEQSKESLVKLEFSDSELKDFTTGFRALIFKSREAIDDCKNIRKSAEALESARIGIAKVDIILDKLVPNLID